MAPKNVNRGNTPSGSWNTSNGHSRRSMASWSSNWRRPISSSELSCQCNVKLLPTYLNCPYGLFGYVCFVSCWNWETLCIVRLRSKPCRWEFGYVRQPELIHAFVYGKDGPQIVSWMDLMKDVDLCKYAFGSGEGLAPTDLTELANNMGNDDQVMVMQTISQVQAAAELVEAQERQTWCELPLREVAYALAKGHGQRGSRSRKRNKFDRSIHLHRSGRKGQRFGPGSSGQTGAKTWPPTSRCRSSSQQPRQCPWRVGRLSHTEAIAGASFEDQRAALRHWPSKSRRNSQQPRQCPWRVGRLSHREGIAGASFEDQRAALRHWPSKSRKNSQQPRQCPWRVGRLSHTEGLTGASSEDRGAALWHWPSRCRINSQQPWRCPWTLGRPSHAEGIAGASFEDHRAALRRWPSKSRRSSQQPQRCPWILGRPSHRKAIAGASLDDSRTALRPWPSRSRTNSQQPRQCLWWLGRLSHKEGLAGASFEDQRAALRHWPSKSGRNSQQPRQCPWSLGRVSHKEGLAGASFEDQSAALRSWPSRSRTNSQQPRQCSWRVGRLSDNEGLAGASFEDQRAALRHWPSRSRSISQQPRHSPWSLGRPSHREGIPGASFEDINRALWSWPSTCRYCPAESWCCVISPVLCHPLNVSWSCSYLVSCGNLELQDFDHRISQSYAVVASNKRHPLGRRMV